MIAKAIQKALYATVYSKEIVYYKSEPSGARLWYRKMISVLPSPISSWVDELRADLDVWSYERSK